MKNSLEAVAYMPDEEQGRLGFAHRRQEARYVESGLRQRHQVQADQAAHWGIRQYLHKPPHLMVLPFNKSQANHRLPLEPLIAPQCSTTNCALQYALAQTTSFCCWKHKPERSYSERPHSKVLPRYLLSSKIIEDMESHRCQHQLSLELKKAMCTLPMRLQAEFVRRLGNRIALRLRQPQDQSNTVALFLKCSTHSGIGREIKALLARTTLTFHIILTC